MAESHRDHPPLRRADLVADPIEQFGAWWARAEEVVPMPEAMTLATVDADGAPDARMVLLKGHGPDGFRFFTNHESAKGTQLAGEPRAALVIYWKELDWQVRVRGETERLADGPTDEYFESRPRESRLGAWASPQSREMPDRAALEARLREVEERFGAGEDGAPAPRPEFWGGYLLRPEVIEFWQNGRSRLHDRFRYTREGDAWRIDRLGP